MGRTLLLHLAILLVFAPELSSQTTISPLQQKAISFIETNKQQFISLSDSIWLYAEPSFKEFKSAGLIRSLLEKEGFSITANAGGFPTVFVATFGNGGPVIGLFGEYDADAGASNKTVPYKEELVKDGYGHGGAHNLLGAGSVAAALAIKDLVKTKKLNCTIRYYGSTAEGSLGTRAWLAKDGYFNDLDISLYWHPAPVTAAGTRTWDALIDFDVSIRSKSAAENFRGVITGLKKSTDENSKIGYSIKSENNDTAVFNVILQCAVQDDALEMFGKIRNAVKKMNDGGAAANMRVNRAHHQFLPNATAMAAVYENMELLGRIRYTPEEKNYTSRMQDHLKSKKDTLTDLLIPFSDASKEKKMYGYSSDIGEASWFAPEIYFVVTCLPSGVNMHQWSGTAFTAHSIGHKGMIQAAKIMSMTIIDYVQKPGLRQKIRNDFEERTRGYKYNSLID